MKNSKVWILFIFLAIFFTGQPIKSQVAPNKFVVSVDVTCDDDITKGQVESYIKRELRSLGDVTINNIIPDYSIKLTIIEPTYTSTGAKSGNIIISSVILKTYFVSDIINHYAPPVSFEKIFNKSNEIGAPPSMYEHYRGSLLNFGKTQNLRNLCEEIVASFDTEVLEPER